MNSEKVWLICFANLLFYFLISCIFVLWVQNKKQVNRPAFCFAFPFDSNQCREWSTRNVLDRRNETCSNKDIVRCPFWFQRSRWFKSNRGSQEKRPFSNGLFSIQSEGLACNLTAGEYVIAEGVWHHASACILLRIDYIQHFVLIPYRRQAADFIHGFAVILRVAFLYYEHIKKP